MTRPPTIPSSRPSFVLSAAFKLVVAPDSDALGRTAASMIADQLRAKPDSVLCTAGGASPIPAYAHLANIAREQTSHIRIVKLDEWLDLKMTSPQTCESFQRRHLLGPLAIPDHRYLTIKSQPADPDAECKRVSAAIARFGGIDLAILGIGLNGHLGLNEPGGALQPFCHIEQLSPATLRHPMLHGAAAGTRRGITLGMHEILGARRILLIATGPQKAEPIRTLLSREITTGFPASFLWLHPDVTCLCDHAAAPQ